MTLLQSNNPRPIGCSKESLGASELVCRAGSEKTLLVGQQRELVGFSYAEPHIFGKN